MKFSKQGFLQAYLYLQKGINTKEANQYLIQLQKSQQAWIVAYQLIQQQSLQNKLYGAQLFSKKVGSKLPQDLSIVQLIKFTLEVVQKNSNSSNNLFLNQLCTAISKLIVMQKNQISAYINQLIQISNVELCLNIIKQLPQCMSNTNNPLSKQEKKQIYKILQPFFLVTIKPYQSHTLQCLQNFNQFCKINILNSFPLVQNLLQISLQKTEVILAQSFRKFNKIDTQSNTFDSITSYVLNPLYSNTPINRKSYINLFLAFSRFYQNRAHQFNEGIFKLILLNSLIFIQLDRQYTIQHFQFWCDLSIKCINNQCNQIYLNIATEAFVQLNKIILNQSMLKKLVSRQSSNKQTPTQKIIQNLQSSQQEQEDPNLALQLYPKGQQNMDRTCLAFRQYASDYIKMCYKVFNLSQNMIQRFYMLMYELTKNNQLQVQLCIFTIKSMIDDVKVQHYKYIKQLLIILYNYAQRSCEDLIIPLLQMLYDCDYVILSDIQLLNQTLKFFLKTFSNNNISKLSSQTLSNIISSLENPIPQIRSSIQKFLNLIYQQFQNIQDQVVLENLTTSLVCLIHKLESPALIYKNFLSTFYDKTKKFPLAKMVIYYKCLFFSHLSLINDLQMNYQLSQLAKIVHPQLLNAYSSQVIHKKKNNITHILNAISRTCGRFLPNEMIQTAKVLLQEGFRKKFQETIELHFFSNVLTNYLQNKNGYINLIRQIWPNIKNTLIKIQRPQITKVFIQFCYKLIDIQQSEQIIDYAANSLQKSFSFQKNRQILRYFINLIKKKKYVKKITKILFRHYSQLKDSFSQQLITAIIEAYKAAGQQPIKQSLTQIKPELLPPNPLYNTLISVIKDGQWPQIMNILLCLN